MSILIPREKSYFFTTSNPGSGVQVSADSSRMSITLDQPIAIPASAVDVSFEVQQASIWNTSPNISVAKGNNKFDYLIASVAQPQITIPDGLYSLDTLADRLSIEFVNAGNAADTISFTGDNSTQKVIATFQATVQMDPTQPNSIIDDLMGFSGAALIPAAPPAGITSETAANVATFNETNTFGIQSDIVSNGIPINNTGKNLIASIPITAAPGFQVIFQPQNPQKVDGNELRGNQKNTFYFQVVNQDATPLPQTEPFTLLLILKYKMLVSNQDVPLMDF